MLRQTSMAGPKVRFTGFIALSFLLYSFAPHLKHYAIKAMRQRLSEGAIYAERDGLCPKSVDWSKPKRQGM